MEVTTMAVFTSPTALKKDLKYLVKISLENNTLVLLVKSLAIKKGVEYGNFLVHHLQVSKMSSAIKTLMGYCHHRVRWASRQPNL